ncbi:bifunctional methylenetetrahydrofolate dehydrogenase/methenyltetrahydrofolate cyclohydrolase FolD [Candidatus Manganitrophus noduliformans]|uniref:Bifunctional protein FolD n=1 Tax=Candidatus Manganitrophus noduliformans TaxID=2606439 RepID=A0A7X6DNX9_9BACT|nr:bifunctional methylenetetrahydrofolate dehydrogenase/methenyltetrahydrofolate cyclohydrolase FolD [Candidatus Manganitrophus noduliformans]NKE70368.1 bifunctional methylenetetrahydrofolate dehydrogenase/methenyltetrahydrofolate cyclohydrolase FolD [Candidatus Manganitrophus noduliformans]
MPAKRIDGKAIAQEVRARVKTEVEKLGPSDRPGLAAVLVGENPASKIYVRNKRKACEEVGIYSEEHHLPEETTEAEVLSLVERLNQDPKIHGILVQLPLPKQINERKVLDTVIPEKDVDGFHYINVGKLVANEKGFVPCTPLGIIELLLASKVEIAGAHAVVVGRSNIVGKPAALLLLHHHATVTICHSKTKNLPEVCRQADILIAAIGKPQFVKKEMVKEGAVVIDVGINRLPDGRIVGDVDFDPVQERAGAITPVPGGVGPMTIAMLLLNTLQSAKWKKEKA